MFDVGLIADFSMEAKDKIVVALLLESLEEIREVDDKMSAHLTAVIKYHLTMSEIDALGL